MARSSFSGPINSTAGFEIPEYTVANAPAASGFANGVVIYVSNGVAGSPGLAFSDGTDWKRVDTPATTIAAS